MTLKYRHIGLTIKSTLSQKNESLKQIVNILCSCGATVYIDKNRCSDAPCSKKLPCLEKNTRIDLMVLIGGDGTLLRTVREINSFQIPVLSINKGRVGFLTEVEIKEAKKIIPPLLQGKGYIDNRNLLEIKATRRQEVIFCGKALNEAVIAQGTIARLIELHTSINNKPLTSYHADGLIVSTPSGSTAYSLAGGGPIVHPHLAAIILTPINPYSFSQKPVVIPGKSQVDIEVHHKQESYHDSDVILTIDGQSYVSLQKNDRVSITLSRQKIKLLRSKQDPFFETLQRKLKWGEKPGET